MAFIVKADKTKEKPILERDKQQMSCSANSNHGIVHLTGPIMASELEKIRATNYFPLSFSFAPRTTIPVFLQRNHIEESIGNSCFYMQKRYNLIDIQICAPLHKGFKLPTENQTPQAECILTYKPAAIDSPPFSSILLCLPIYTGGVSAYDAYLDQIINHSDISCGYENQSGKQYEGADQNTIKDTTLSKCIKTCCDDNQCLAYTFGGGTCHIKHTIPNLITAENSTIISGKINRSKTSSASSSSSSSSALAETIQSLFYQKDGTTTHTILSYQSCFETVSDKLELLNRYSMCVMYFPTGIRMNSKNYENLVLQLQGNLTPYQFPPVLRSNERTLTKYRMDDGKKIPTESSSTGELYVTSLTSCSEDFKKRFTYFILPKRSETRVSSSLKNNTEQCKTYTTAQYKCVPFNELTDLSGNVVIPGNTTLEDIRKKQAEEKAKASGSSASSSELSSGEIEAIVGGSIGGIIMLYLLYRGAIYIFNRPS